MKPNQFPQLYLMLLLFSLLACKETREKTEAETAIQTATVPINESPRQEVAVGPVKTGTFSLQTFTNGKLEARQKVKLQARASGYLMEYELEEGKRIQKDALVLRLDDSELQYRRAQILNEIDDALFKKKDLLIRSGGEADTDNSVAPEVLKNILIQSGYNKAQQNLKQIDFEISRMRQYAPFSGVVADLKVRANQVVSGGQELCTLINPNSYEAVFTLLEKEAVQLRIGQMVKIKPTAYLDKSISAKVTAINPMVDKNGLLTVRARLNATKTRLFDGMNIAVSVEKKVKGYLSIPKEALVMRSGREVVFVYDEQSGLAKWKYVKVAYENEDSLAISEGLETGQLVIHQGNLNLDHDAQVVVKE